MEFDDVLDQDFETVPLPGGSIIDDLEDFDDGDLVDVPGKDPKDTKDTRASMAALEQALEEESWDLNRRFDSERPSGAFQPFGRTEKPSHPGLDRSLGEIVQTRDAIEYATQRYSNKSAGFVTGFDPMAKEELEKKARRAARFGVSEQAAAESTPQAQPLEAESSGMDVDINTDVVPDDLPEAPPITAIIRKDTIHLHGTDRMSTKDVLKYFEDFGPSHVEWIDDASCNIVFKEYFTAKRALYNMLLNPTDVTFGEDDIQPGLQDPSEGIVDARIPTSKNRLQRGKGYIPIQPLNHPLLPKNNGLFLRFATDLDKKERGAATKSAWYAIHGRDALSGRGRPSVYSYHNRPYDSIWNEGRGIETLGRIYRRRENEKEGRGQSHSRSRSSSPLGPRRDSLSPESRNRARDDYDRRGGRSDISSRLGTLLDDAVEHEDRSNELAQSFMAELESSFTRREREFPRGKGLYSDVYESDLISESMRSREERRDRDNTGRRHEEERDRRDHRDRGRGRDREYDRNRDRDRDRHRNRDNGRDHRRSGGGRNREEREALQALESRLGTKPIEDRLGTRQGEEVDEFGRTRR
ncbi:hypothetical protein DFQ27_004295 [Actinomortierella ambigua]|uniref:Nuclear cap-binding protein subunit 3 n=1 Tax=Actinomortierella ambigua TaxID=1343610 RepID=A0A9P6QMP6_9FUNG|nr:hypothetical protein DFQ27_004295 [Actinomortierella ambigua]